MKLEDWHKILIIGIAVLLVAVLIYFFNPIDYINREKTISIYSSENDGYIYEDDTASSLKTAWNNVIDDDDGTCDKTGDIYIGTRTDGGNTTAYRARIYRGFLIFDTTAITGTITTASLRLYVEDIYTKQDYNLVVQIDDDFVYPHIPLDNDDYEQDQYDGDYGSIDADDITENNYVTIALDPDVINKGGWTKICLRSSRDIDDSRGSSNKKAYLVIASGDDNDTAKYPMLLINP